MTTPDPQAAPFQSEDITKAPAFPQASTPGYDETTATPGATTYGTAYDAPVADPYAQQGYGVSNLNTNAQGAHGAEAYGQLDYEQATHAAGQQTYGQPVYSQPAHGQPLVAGVPKQWIVTLFLAFFLGTLGIHSFYLGYTTKGIIRLILTVIMIGTPIATIWTFTGFIIVIARLDSYAYDVQGQPLW